MDTLKISINYTPWLWCAGGDAGGAGSEDCLNVNIYAPVGVKPSSKCRTHSVELVLSRRTHVFWNSACPCLHPRRRWASQIFAFLFPSQLPPIKVMFSVILPTGPSITGSIKVRMLLSFQYITVFHLLVSLRRLHSESPPMVILMLVSWIKLKPWDGSKRT